MNAAEKARMLFWHGEDIGAIARQLNVSNAQVWTWLNETRILEPTNALPAPRLVIERDLTDSRCALCGKRGIDPVLELCASCARSDW